MRTSMFENRPTYLGQLACELEQEELWEEMYRWEFFIIPTYLTI